MKGDARIFMRIGIMFFASGLKISFGTDHRWVAYLGVAAIGGCIWDTIINWRKP